jgi:hypothetical protein
MGAQIKSGHDEIRGCGDPRCPALRCRGHCGGTDEVRPDEPRPAVRDDADPDARSLLDVKIREAGDIFAKLMGDEVEPRRDFIQANARSVANFDI